MATGREEKEQYLADKLNALRSSYEETLLAPREAETLKTESLLVVQVDDTSFSVPIRSLLHVTRLEGVVDVPSSPAAVLGAISFRQEIVSVVDLRKVLQLKGHTDRREGWVLVLRPKRLHWGVVVDSLLGLERIEQDRLTDVDGQDGGSAISGDGIILEESFAAVLRTERLIPLLGIEGLEV